MNTCFHTEHIDGRCVKCGWVLDRRQALIVEARRKHCPDCDHFIAAMADELERLTS